MRESSVTWESSFGKLIASAYLMYCIHFACIVQLPLADDFLENRSIRAKKSLLYSWQIMLGLQSWGESCLHRRKRSEMWGFPPFISQRQPLILSKDSRNIVQGWTADLYAKNAGAKMTYHWVECGVSRSKIIGEVLRRLLEQRRDNQNDRSKNDLCLRGTKGSWREPLWSKLSSNWNGNPRILESHRRSWLFCDESINVNSTCFRTGADDWACCARLVINRNRRIRTGLFL